MVLQHGSYGARAYFGHARFLALEEPPHFQSEKSVKQKPQVLKHALPADLADLPMLHAC
jgi:hypothetical protein